MEIIYLNFRDRTNLKRTTLPVLYFWALCLHYHAREPLPIHTVAFPKLQSQVQVLALSKRTSFSKPNHIWGVIPAIEMRYPKTAWRSSIPATMSPVVSGHTVKKKGCFHVTVCTAPFTHWCKTGSEKWWTWMLDWVRGHSLLFEK